MATTIITSLSGCNPGNGGGPLSDIHDPDVSGPTSRIVDKIVFVRRQGGNPDDSGQIWIMNADGSNQKQLTNGPNDSAPVISDNSADGRNQIAFIRSNQLWTMNSEGANAKQRTFDSSGTLQFRAVADPDWRPGNEEITFAGLTRTGSLYHIYSLILRDNSIAIYTGNADNPETSINPPKEPNTIGEREFTKDRSDEFDPAWAPDGQSLVFVTDRHYRLNPGQGFQRTVFEIYRLSFNTGFGNPPALTRLTAHKSGAGVFTEPTSRGSVANPVISPNGNQIAFQSADVTGSFQVYVIGKSAVAATTSQWSAISNTPTATFPTYSVDSRSVIFSRNGNIFAVTANAESSSNPAKQLTTQGGLQPSRGKVTEVVVRPTPTPRPVPTATTPPFGACTGSEGTVNAETSFNLTVKRLANGNTQGFPNFIQAGDHEANGDGTVQGYFGFPISQLPPVSQLTNARLQMVSGPSQRQGNPFGALSPLHVEPVNSPGSLHEGALLPNSATLTPAGSILFKGDVTNAVKQAKSQNKSHIFFRVRFQQSRNNNGQTDLASFDPQPVMVICTTR